MKSFLKYTLATITGLILTSILFFVIMLASLSAMFASTDKAVSISGNSVLVLNVGTTIPDRGIDDPFSSFDFMDMTFKPSVGLNDIIKNLRKAVDDEKIKGILIENGPMYNGWGKAEEIRKALLEFKESGKFVLAYSDYYMPQEGYFISTAADKIYLNPASIFEFKGLSTEVIFYRKALEKLGINVQVIRHGKYKGAVEKFILDKLSDENREQISQFTFGIWNTVLNVISHSRDISPVNLNQIADKLQTSDLEQAIKSGMVDGLKYRDELKEEIKELIDTEIGSKPEYVSMSKYNNVARTANAGKEGKIALVFAEGTIVMGKGSTSSIGGSHYASLLRKLREDGGYDALVLRINSPGGNAMASDMIWREVELTAMEMPVVVSMSNYAASGGYYIAAPATSIFAQPTTITGSIGVFGLVPQAQDLLEGKLGITSDAVNTNKYSDAPSLIRPMDKYETTIFQQNVDKTYDEFISRVSEGRDIEKEEVDRMGQGQVYFGTHAIEKGLVDKLGGLNDAIEEAGTLASLESYRIVELPVIEDTYTKLLKSISGDIKMRIMENELGVAARYYRDLNDIKTIEGIQARMPYLIDIK